jgi:hypothetical protein
MLAKPLFCALDRLTEKEVLLIELVVRLSAAQGADFRGIS